MKRKYTRSTTRWLLLASVLFLVAPLTACHEKTPSEKVKDGLEEAGDGISDAADDVKDSAEDLKDDIKDELDGGGQH